MLEQDFIARLVACRSEVELRRAELPNAAGDQMGADLDDALIALETSIDELRQQRRRPAPVEGESSAPDSSVDAPSPDFGAGIVSNDPLSERRASAATPPFAPSNQADVPANTGPRGRGHYTSPDARAAADQETRLRSLAAEIVIADEYARRSLASVLHEDLGQDLALARMKLSALRGQIGEAARETFVQVEGLVAKADRSIHAITFQLSPPSLHDLGLVPALEWLAEDAEARLGITVRIEDEDSAPIHDDRMRVILFRAVRELLNNVAMHSGVKAACVRTSSGPRHLRISVEDEGRGFDASIVDAHGYGLFGIREQVRHLGGSTLVDSRIGGGTNIVIAVPLPAPLAPTT
ncbi:MAG: hypothetical protein IPJ77_21625 [Planctomycetes bacterium]|nr:hypothetical protein [Planctomycetota bacterium]